MNTRGLGVTAWLACLGLASMARAEAPAPFPPAAQMAIDTGVAAARAGQYPEALAAFEAARAIAPAAPVIYLDMGLAESRIPGRELRAMAWLGAYLAADPSASNGAAVKAQIAALQATNRANLLRLVKLLQARAMEAPSDFQLINLATELASVGAIEEARITAESIQTGAFKLAATSRVAAEDVKTRIAAADSRLSMGDVLGARDILAAAQSSVVQITEARPRFDARLAMADALGKAGDSARAQRSLDDAGTLVGRIDEPKDRTEALIALGRARATAGQTASASESFAAAESAAAGARDYKEQLFNQIAVGLAENRQIAEGLRVADLAPGYKAITQTNISGVQLRAGDITGALATARLIDGAGKASALGAIAVAQFKAGDPVAARATLQASEKASGLRAGHEGPRPYLLVDLADAQRNIGDVAGAERTFALAQQAADRVPWTRGAGFSPDGAARKDAQRAVAVAIARSRVANDEVYSWIEMLDTPESLGGALSPATFRDLEGQLKSISSDTREGVVNQLMNAADLLIARSAEVDEKLKRQLGK